MFLLKAYFSGSTLSHTVKAKCISIYANVYKKNFYELKHYVRRYKENMFIGENIYILRILLVGQIGMKKL